MSLGWLQIWENGMGHKGPTGPNVMPLCIMQKDFYDTQNMNMLGLNTTLKCNTCCFQIPSKLVMAGINSKMEERNVKKWI